EIFAIIKESKKGKLNNIITFIESKCRDAKTITELLKIKEHHVFEASDSKKLIMDFIKELDNYKLNKRLDELKRQQKVLECSGKIEESIHIAIELTKISDLLKRGARR
ncbi:MAG: DNA primase, partial [Clostridium sp.]